MSRRVWIGPGLLVALFAAAACLLWPAPALDADRLDGAVPTVQDLPGWVAHDGLTGSLSGPAGNVEGRSVLTGAKLAEQCAIRRTEGDGWACAGWHGVGMVVLELRSKRVFRAPSTVVAYDDEDATVAVWKALRGDHRAVVKDRATERDVDDLGDEAASFAVDGVAVFAIRTSTVVVESIVRDGSDQVSEAEERAVAGKWPARRLRRIDRRR